MMKTGLFRHRDFVRLWQAATISTFGNMLTAIALPLVAILELDAGPRQLAGLAFAGFLPRMAVGLVAGAWADRVRRRRLLIAADLGRAVLLVWVPAGAVLGVLDFAQLYAVALSVGVLWVLFDVADKAYLPEVVGKEDLVEANGKLAGGAAVAEASAFAGGGWLVQLATAPAVLVIDAATFIVSAALIGTLRTPDLPPAAPAAGRSLVREIAAGIRYLKTQPTLRVLATSNALRHFSYGVFLTSYMLFCVDTLGLAPGLLGMIFALGSLSSLAGAGVASRVSERLGMERGSVLGYAIFAAAATLIPLAPAGGWLGVALLAIHQLFGDGGDTLFNVTEASLRQSLTPADLLGRLNGSVAFLNGSALLLGALFAGEAGELLGPRAALFCSLATAYAGVVVLSRIRGHST